MEIKTASKRDLKGLLELYCHLNMESAPAIDKKIKKLWNKILKSGYQQILVGHYDNKIVSSCVLIIVDNLTRDQRPYAIIENVVTHKDYRNRGFATAILNRAIQIAKSKNCYKIMLSTSSKLESTLRFYENAGFNSRDKTAFVMWL
ncbi:MAG TPA: GNAT family N-acetyltransferase [Clostridia bacterium]|jgi:GNAT superfamily N-acetyltransferase